MGAAAIIGVGRLLAITAPLADASISPALLLVVVVASCSYFALLSCVFGNI